MTLYRKLSATLLLLSATALVGVAIASAPVLAAQGGIPGPNPDAPGQSKKNGPTVSTTDGPVRGIVKRRGEQILGYPLCSAAGWRFALDAAGTSCASCPARCHGICEYLPAGD